MFEDVWTSTVGSDVGLDYGGKGCFGVVVEVVVDACFGLVVGILKESGLEVGSRGGGDKGVIGGNSGECG